jgi:2'-5' RNA ligase
VEARRLFLALDAPEPVCHALTALAVPLPGVAWTPPQRLHLTLRFLGDTPVASIGALCERLRAIRVAPFFLPVAGLGVFPPRGQPRVLWCGVGRGHPHLYQLRQRVDDSILALGLEADLKSFVPHFTLARLGSAKPAAIAHWLHRWRDFEAPPFRVERFRLFASELRPTEAVHVLLEEFPLAPV